MVGLKEEFELFKFKEIITLYHTRLRNVGLYTSISLAILASSRYYKGKNKVSHLLFVLISMGFLFSATHIDYMLIKDQLLFMKKMKKERKKYIMEMTYVPVFVFLMNLFVIVFSFYNLYSILQTMVKE